MRVRHGNRERARAEEELRDCVQREKKAREQAEASDSFKEMFLGILGYDLRNPLNTVLTTARLMTMRGELPPDSHKRLERVIVTGVRMERMIEQLLDLARARPASGIPSAATSNRTWAGCGVPVLPKPVDIRAVWDCMRQACSCATGDAA
jgi:signal transduction histidine kinase